MIFLLVFLFISAYASEATNSYEQVILMADVRSQSSTVSAHDITFSMYSSLRKALYVVDCPPHLRTVLWRDLSNVHAYYQQVPETISWDRLRIQADCIVEEKDGHTSLQGIQGFKRAKILALRNIVVLIPIEKFVGGTLVECVYKKAPSLRRT